MKYPHSREIFDKLLQSERLQGLAKAFKENESVLIEGLWNAPKALIATLAALESGKHIVFIMGSSAEETRLYHDFALFSDLNVVDFPAWETLPSENLPPSPDIVGDRYRALMTLKQSNSPHIILTNLQACLQKLIPQSLFQKLYLKLQKGQIFAFTSFIDKLIEMGYTRHSVASDKGEFAVRGGIIDIYPVSSPDPVRIEFWGDEIESIRLFDPIGQRSIKQVDEIDIPPGKELVGDGLLLTPKENASKLETLLQYLGKNTLIVFDDLLSIEDHYTSLMSLSSVRSPLFSSLDEWMEESASLQKIFISASSIEDLSDVKVLDRQVEGYYSETSPLYLIEFEIFGRSYLARRFRHSFKKVQDALFNDYDGNIEMGSQDILEALGKLPHKTFNLEVICQTEADILQFKKRADDSLIHLPQKTHFQIGYLTNGLFLEDIHTALFPTTELTHRYKIRRQKQRSTYHSTPAEVYDLSPGEVVVHMNHGIGKFLGLEKIKATSGAENEFMQIEYADRAKLYVPLQQTHLVSKYIGAAEESPKLHALGSSRWKKSKEQTERAILGYAKELLELYAKREIKSGHPCPQDGPEIVEFENEFPFVETEDQQKAIVAIKNDMVSEKSMDRLICGDVGYGKTEVAMRAAFKAVMDGRTQVAVLVPTTFLAMQHFETFCERMANFPINIEVISRFRTQKQVKKALEGIYNGSIDILIGTHRIVSDDVQFKNLGLVIIDEEQRFGVKAKEHLKRIKTGVDCITLSATPIPRTLYMSLIGARDLSAISTPPQDRVPITTIITEPNDHTIKTALLRELARGGQAYVIHNRVESIHERASHIKKLLPQARIVVGHGQMHSDEIDSVFHAFKSGSADILIATTIVESGIDIPNANTILIDRADTFGMADLYQLRGRVGRWNRRAYAYFLVPRLHALPEVTRHRLNALAESSGYGGGMKVAMRDLEIRGAGNILGIEQSGHVSTIGFHLYCKLLKRTIKAMQGKIPSAMTDVKMEFPFDARLPESFINEVSLRMEVYQRLGDATDIQEVDEIFKELQDRFGEPPEPALWLYHMTKVRVFASRHSITHLKLEKRSLLIEKHSGKQLFSKRVLMTEPKSPQDFENRLLDCIRTY